MTYQLINESDLNCSFYMHEEGKLLPDIQIIGAERVNEKSVYEDGDLIYLNRGAADGLEMGQLFLTIGLRAKVAKLRHGRRAARPGPDRPRLDDRMASARVEKGCGRIQVGDFLLPFEEESGEIGKDLGYGDMDPNASKRGHVIYIENDFHISGSGSVGPDRHGPAALCADRRPAQRLSSGPARTCRRRPSPAPSSSMSAAQRRRSRSSAPDAAVDIGAEVRSTRPGNRLFPASSVG